ncbi:unnamed protein product [Sphagnum jensenii]|uniref:FHA domain-containing protein n=1 Tax=Sphagnum jensenii TaxID=128206 RepID=A0ABP0VIK5_9BRYO
MEVEGERENQNGGKRSYSLMALSAPMFFSKDERACQRLELRPGKFYTIGRSRSSCDVIFHDNRVSRQHCQVFLEPGSQKLYLLDGAPSRLRTKRLQESRSDDKSSSSKRVKPSLNGIFLNGQRVEDGACKVLAPGDEVSLVACTKCAQAVDPDFGAAVGFLVKVVPEYERQAVQNSLHLPPNNRKTENNSQLITKSSEEGDKPAIFPAFGPQTTCEPILGKLQSTSILLSEASNPSLRPLAGGVFEECLPGLLGEKGDLLLGNLGVEALTANSLVNIRGQAPEDLPELLDISTQKRCSESTGNGLASEDKSRSISMETHTLALETLLYKDAELTVSSISVSKRRAIEARSGILAKSLFTRLCPDIGKGPGFRGFCLNRLEDSEGTDEGVSLQELLAPLKDLVAIFAATFSGDILWFLTSNNLPADLPVTVACHDYERCWSTSEKDRTASPYPQWPNLTIVYPPFPDICAFSSKSKEGLRRGIGCHHPKLFLLRFQDKLRVVISSANLNQRQWLRTTNTVWWRDFPQLKIRNYHALFHSSGVSKGDSVPSSTAGDFGAQLAYFVSCLLVDVPAMAHWVVGLAQYDFSGAEASLVVSIPGVHGSLCSSVHQNSMENLELGTSSHSLPRKLLGIVSSTVVGITFRFCAAADPNGSRVRALAKLLNSIDPDEDGMIVVLLRRAKNVPADCNAVSVVVNVRRDSNSPSSSQDQCIQLGFLPRNMAKSVAPLCDGGLFAFIARIWPKEALSVASGFSESYVRLNLYIYEGPRFHELSTAPPTSEQAIAVSGLLSMLQYALGLHRLEQVLSRYKWPNSAETDFIFGSSSIGTSLDAPFLAAFSAAAGHRAIASSASDDSDSQWGCWTAEHEAENPSIGVVFPTIDRAKAAKDGVLSHYGLLCFAEKTWERLKPAKLLHDAVPSSASRDGIPMHSKVAIRRFQHHPSEASFGWVYCGSHNFSPAAWGRPLARAPANTIPVVGTALHISNYELGLIFVEPPPRSDFSSDTNDSNSQVQVSKPVKGSEVIGLDRFQLPFVMPPPRYQASDQPATGRAMYGILLELQNQCNTLEEVVDLEERLVEGEVESGESEHIEDAEMVGKVEDVTVGQIKASQSEQQYAEALWSQMT